MLIAVAGNVHGEFYHVHKALLKRKKIVGDTVDLLIVCGNMLAARNASDLTQVVMPDRYQSRHSFYKYYTRELMAPTNVLFIGGEQEAYNFLMEMYFGGWVAPRVFYMGHAGCVQYGGLRIAGISGVFDERHYESGYFESYPLVNDDIETATYTRRMEMQKLMSLSGQADIVLSHDWPRGILQYGDDEVLINHRPQLAKQIAADAFGNPHLDDLMTHLRPGHWFSARWQLKWSAAWRHANGQQTLFYSAPKTCRRKDFLQYFDIPSKNDDRDIQFDPEWLAITRLSSPLLSCDPASQPIELTSEAIQAETDVVRAELNDQLKVPLEFERTVKPHKFNHARMVCKPKRRMDYLERTTLQLNPYTSHFMERMRIADPFVDKRNRTVERKVEPKNRLSKEEKMAMKIAPYDERFCFENGKMPFENGDLLGLNPTSTPAFRMPAATSLRLDRFRQSRVMSTLATSAMSVVRRVR
ncbi:Lariat debranching enzyme C-terminal domain-containing protein [Plasmodiophora brassicae]